MEQRESFIFYRSFYEAISEADDQTQLNVYRAIAEYALNRNESPIIGLGSIIFKLAKPQLDANWKRYENGCKGKDFGKLGGAPIGNSNASKQPQNNPTAVEETTPNVNDNDNDNHNPNLNPNANVNEKENGTDIVNSLSLEEIYIDIDKNITDEKENKWYKQFYEAYKPIWLMCDNHYSYSLADFISTKNMLSISFELNDGESARRVQSKLCAISNNSRYYDNKFDSIMYKVYEYLNNDKK